MDDLLLNIIEFADQAHGDQKRKYTPERYIVHPVRVMEMVRPYNDSLPVLSAAILHDVLEDTPVGEHELAVFLAEKMDAAKAQKTTRLVVELTDIYTRKDYPHWNRAKRRKREAERMSKTSAEAQTIKYADIIDNCREISIYDPEFAPVFLRECKFLLDLMQDGNKELYQKAVEIVQMERRKLPKRK